MKLFILLRDLFDVDAMTARQRMRSNLREEQERIEQHRMVRKMIWEYKQSPAALQHLSLSDEQIQVKEGAD